MTQPDVSTATAPVRQFAKFDFSHVPNIIPIIVEKAGHSVPTQGVMLCYLEPQPVLDAHFKSAVHPDYDEFPHQSVRAVDERYYVFSEIHDLSSLQQLREQGHPQTQELASAYQLLVQVLYPLKPKSGLSLV